MATGRIGVTPTLGVRWSKAPTGGTTSLSGLDDNSVSLVYSVGYEQVYRNGTLLSRGNDYTATNGTTITLVDATLAGDIVEVFANELIPLTDAISKGQYNAKGALLSATAAATPGVLAVGANDTVLTADSTTATGLKWATPTAGGMTLISTTTLSGTSVTLSSIPSTYKHLLAVFSGITTNSNYYFSLKPNNASNCTLQSWDMGNSTGTVSPYSANEFYFNSNTAVNSSNAQNAGNVWIYNYASTTVTKSITGFFEYSSPSSTRAAMAIGIVDTTSAISSLVFGAGGNTFTAGTLLLYGVS